MYIIALNAQTLKTRINLTIMLLTATVRMLTTGKHFWKGDINASDITQNANDAIFKIYEMNEVTEINKRSNLDHCFKPKHQ